jgi:hypothetical protein
MKPGPKALDEGRAAKKSHQEAVMRIRLLCALCCVAFLGTVPAAAGAQDWKKHSYPAEGFEVEFSGPVKVEREDDASVRTKGALVRSAELAQATADGGVYIVSLVETPKPRAYQRWVEGAMGSFAAVKCAKGVTFRQIEFPGANALEMSGSGCFNGSLSVLWRQFQVDKLDFQVTAVFKPEGNGPANATRFVRSFALIQQGK